MDRSVLGRLVLVLAASAGVFLFFFPLPKSVRSVAVLASGLAAVAGLLLARSGDRAQAEESRHALETIEKWQRERRPRP